MCKRPKPSFSDALANLRKDESQQSVVRGMLGIAWNRLINRETCCGNYGDPGC